MDGPVTCLPLGRPTDWSRSGLSEGERALNLSEKKFDLRDGLRGFWLRGFCLRGARLQERGVRFALAGTVALAAWTSAQPSLLAQVIKAPRYSGAVDAPVQSVNLPALPAAISPHGVVVEDVVARVNDQIISRSDVERSAAQLQQDAQQNKLGTAELSIAQRDMLRDMIDEQLLISKAKELGLNADADVIRQLDDIRKKNNMDSLDDLEKAARAQGVNFEDFKAQIRNQILKQEVVRDEVGRKLQLSETEEKKYYDEHLKDFQQPEQIRLSEILVPLPETATPEQIAQAEAKANDIRTKIAAGQDFSELAKQYSGGSTAAKGGELGLYKRNSGLLAQVLEDQTFPLKVGDSTQPIRTRQGFVILKVIQHDQAGPTPMKDVEPQIQEAVYMAQMQPALRAYLTKLRGDSYVELAPGFVDSGSNGTESKLLYTAYAPPAVKKKKAKSKARFERGRYQPVAAQKKEVIASPDTTGGRTITGPDAKPAIEASNTPAAGAAPAAVAAPAAGVDPGTGLAVIGPSKPVSKKEAARIASGKAPKKQKKEKIRFGQAPRLSIPAGSEDESASVTAPAAAAPGAAMSSNPGASATTASAAGDAANPLEPAEAPVKKTRFAATATKVKEKKVATVSAKVREKQSAVATPASTAEQADTKQQTAPLGLSGDTTKKPKKPKKVKGAPKERLADKAPAPKAQPAAEVAPTASPSLAPTDVPATPAKPTQPQNVPNSSIPRPVQNQPDTTLPPVTQPPPGSPQQGQPVPPQL